MDTSSRHTDSPLALALLAAILFAGLFTGGACSQELESPSPEFTGEKGATSQDEALAHPGFVCSAQQERWVEIHGKNFAPVPVGVVDDDGERRVNWPHVELTRVQNMQDEPVESGISVEIDARGEVLRDGTGSKIPRPDGDAAQGGGFEFDTGGESGGGPSGDVDESPFGSDTGDAGEADDAGGSPFPDDIGGGGDNGGSDDESTGGSRQDVERNIIWLDDTRLRFKVSPDMNLKGGLYDITVSASRLPGDFQAADQESVTAEAALGILPPPRVRQVGSGAPLCLENNDRQVTLRGAYFLRREDKTPSVRIGDRSFEVDALEGCRNPGEPFGPYRVCSEIQVTIPQGTFPASAPAVHVRNFGPGECHNRPERTNARLDIVEPPVVTSVAPDPVCSRQVAYEDLAIRGRNFVSGTSGVKPSVQIGETPAQNVRLSDCNSGIGPSGCSTLEVALPAGALASEDEAGVQKHRITVEHPSSVQCATTSRTAVTSVPPPEIDRVVPGAVVPAGDSATVTLRGRNFVRIGQQKPSVTVENQDTSQTYEPTALGDCRSVGGAGDQPVDVCGTATFELPADAFSTPDDAATLDLTLGLANPEPVSCSLPEEATTTLTLVDGPSVSNVETTPVCTANQEKTVTIAGSNFMRFEDRGPTVAIGMNDFQARVVSSSCEEANSNQSDVQRCGKIRFDAPADVLRSVTHDMTVYNPEPVGGFTEGSDLSLTVVGAPKVTAVEPPMTCLVEEDRTLTLRGENFVRVVPETATEEVRLPSVEVAQTDANVGDVSVPNPSSNCEEISVPGAGDTYQSCSLLEVPLSDAGEEGVANLTIRNPAPADCTSERTLEVELSPKPEVTDAKVAPTSSCDESGYRRVVIEGNHLLSRNGTLPTVTIDSTDLEPLEANGCTPVSGLAGDDHAYCDELVVYAQTSTVSSQSSEPPVTVENPAPSSCSSNLQSFEITRTCD